MTKGSRNVASVVMDMLAVIMQASALFIILLLPTRYSHHALPSATDVMQNVGALLLVSLRYWENFVERDIGSISLRAFRVSLQRYRCKIYIFASIWKICLTLAFAYLLVPNMTSMRDIFMHIGNETAYDNRTNVALETFDSGEFDLPPSPTLDTELLLPADALDTQQETNDNLLLENEAANVNQSLPEYDQLPPGDTQSEAHDAQARPQERKRRQTLDKLSNVNSMLDAIMSQGAENEANTQLGVETIVPQDDGAAGNTADTRRARKRPEKQRSSAKRRPADSADYSQAPVGDDGEYGGELVGEESQGSHSKPTVSKLLYRFIPLIMQVVSSALCYYVARVTCKLCMQGFSFALPLTMATPTAFVVFIYFCHVTEWTRLQLPGIEIGSWRCSENFERFSFQWQIGCALGLWWLSQLWINNHIWFSRSERLAKVERYMRLPMS